MAHPRAAAALAAGEVSESVARTLCQWTDKLPEKRREDADEVLLSAAAGGLGLADLAGLFAEIYQRSQADKAADAAAEPGQDSDETFEDRAVRLLTTFGGAGVLHGDLTPECAAAVQAVLDALAAPAGAEDTRSQEQRAVEVDAVDVVIVRDIDRLLVPSFVPLSVYARLRADAREGRDGTIGGTITHGDGSSVVRARQRPRLTWMTRRLRRAPADAARGPESSL